MKISLAELEYRIEKDQIDIINLSQKIQSLRMANEKDSFVDDVGKEECLYKYITKYEITFLVAADLESARYALSCQIIVFSATLFWLLQLNFPGLTKPSQGGVLSASQIRRYRC